MSDPVYEKSNDIPKRITEKKTGRAGRLCPAASSGMLDTYAMLAWRKRGKFAGGAEGAQGEVNSGGEFSLTQASRRGRRALPLAHFPSAGWRGVISLLVLLFFPWSIQAKETLEPTVFRSVEGLRSAISSHLSQTRFGAAQWGIKVISKTNSEVVFEHQSEILLKPASNAKLYSGALALEMLGPDFRIKTSVFAQGKPDANGVIDGNLVIYGRGDPSFSVRFNGGNYDTILQPLVAAITNAGVKEVRGKLVGDETYFQGPPYGSGWSWDDLQYYYGAEISPLTVQDNVVDFSINAAEGEDNCIISGKPSLHPLNLINRTVVVDKPGHRELNFYRPVGQMDVYVTGKFTRTNSVASDAVAVPEPGKWFLALLKQALIKNGVKVSGEMETARWPTATKPLTNGLEEIAFSLSPPYSEMLPKMMKPSQNLYAQLFLLQVGAQAAARKNDNTTFTEDLGLAEMNQFMGTMGVPRGRVLLEEGSGLSRGALVTPAATAALLQYMAQSPNSQVFFDSLPVAGVDGTLRFRLRDKGLFRNVRAKTGTIRFVNTLSGYMKTVSGEELIFSIFLNAYRPSGPTTARQDLDRVIELLYQLDRNDEKTSDRLGE